MQASAKSKCSIQTDFTTRCRRCKQNWQNLGSDILSLHLTTTGTTAVNSKSHIAQKKGPFIANTFMSRRGGRNEGGEEFLCLERDLDLKRSKAEKIVAATEASQTTVVCKRAIRG